MSNQLLTIETFSIKTQTFEGPLELLLDLVEKHKFLINDISLASVTDEYMSQVSLMQELSLPNTAQFIALAATLLLIKSRSLLPVLELTEEEEEGIDDLEVRLKRYQLYRDIAQNVSEIFGTQIEHERQFLQQSEPLFVTDIYSTVTALEEAMHSVLANLPRKEVKQKVKIKTVISLEEMIAKLHKRIEQQVKTTLKELLENNTERAHIIVGFLAILESVKQGSILVAQANRFEDIEIEKHHVTAPKYY